MDFKSTEVVMAAPPGFIGTIEDDEEVDNEDIDSEEEEVAAYKTLN